MSADAVAAIDVGRPVVLSPLVRRLTAPNAGVMTGPGTNTYLVGHDEIVVIDPGPADEGHLDAIVAAGSGRIRWIVVTHTHPDHSPGAEPLRRKLRPDVLVLGFEGGRDGFEPDAEIPDGHVIAAGDFTLRAIHTPGHASNHLCYLLEEEGLLFSGDHIMNGSTVVISPPDGDMSAYLRSLDALRPLDLRAIAPAHGLLVTDAEAKIDEYVGHRLDRERKVVAALEEIGRPATAADLVPLAYRDVDRSRHGLARSSLWAHLRKLHDDGRAQTTDRNDVGGATWEIVPAG